MTRNSPNGEDRTLRNHLIGGTIIALALTVGIGGWAASTELSGAITASGSVVVDSNVKKVQHLTGGIVGELLVREGDHVRTGDTLVRLDETVLRAGLAIVTKGLDEMRARKARLASERDGVERIVVPPELIDAAPSPEFAAALDSERKLFDLRRTAREGQKSQLRQRIAQLDDEVSGYAALQRAKAEEIQLIERELTGVRILWEKNLIQITRLTVLEREAARLRGELAQSMAASAQVRGKVSEIELQIIQINQDLSSEVAKELREIDGKIGEFIERKVTAEDQLKRVDIRAPQNGVVHQLNVHTVGGVVSPADPLMLIVPEADLLTVEAKVSPQDIDQLYVGQPASLRFTAFNQRTTPEIQGAIRRISADVTSDQRTGQNFYTARVSITAEELARLGNVKLLPGMPAEIFAKTYDRSVLSYFTKPLSDQIVRAFRER
ncbi:HlyD family type I secretion periplasmic adaptor subunit [Bradyrhizobium sp. KBS0727]|jgi:HlyD family secretion protein|uniref:HlyD family type I secretion periplasmic adaptor subunit n=1 Tax=unclassified Bradyrhizobium TaxID=2631580 RepID=UPI00110E273E|nr:MULTISPECIES: HlyD family type I secretion periplasmic adaptor subunit [unclassified Bradyrhizobium]QDW37725.1 HlyD family type I secretion periplasmic adaptor subunit [Bradyrhizobium sp. KBS0725]QDW44329.1 HlyD family type I secretion periplasmic adaptor subunit [Bradyrhizobium sp. KBS0727]